MKTIALLSGGKDSILSVLIAMRYGHTPAVIANMAPAGDVTGDSDLVNEVDSYMFQTVGHEAIAEIAHCMQLPLRRSSVRRGQAKEQSLCYAAQPPEGDEVEEMYRLLKAVKEEFPNVRGVTTGAILSNYQRNRVEVVCNRLGLVSLAYLWQRRAAEVLDMVTSLRVQAVVVKVASVGLEPQIMLGKTLEQVRPTLQRMQDLYGSHMAGEGGEFETIVRDCPLYKEEALTIDRMHVVMVDENAYSPSGHCVLGVRRTQKGKEERTADAHLIEALREDDTGLVFPSDSPAALPSPGNLPGALRSSSDEGSTTSTASSLFTFLEATLEEVAGVHCHSVSSKGNCAASFHDTFAAATQWLMSSKAVAVACDITCSLECRARSMQAYDGFAPALNPPSRSLTCTCSGSYGSVGIVALDESTEAASRQVLHVQSLSCWAAGLPGSRHSQAWRYETRSDSIVVAHGVLGLVPITGLLAGITEAAKLIPAFEKDPRPHPDVQRAAVFAAQFAYAYANAVAYVGTYGLHTLTDECTRVCVAVTNEEDASMVQKLWRWCTNQQAVKMEGNLSCVMCSGLSQDALVELTAIRVKRHVGTTSDDE